MSSPSGATGTPPSDAGVIGSATSSVYLKWFCKTEQTLQRSNGARFQKVLEALPDALAYRILDDGHVSVHVLARRPASSPDCGLLFGHAVLVFISEGERVGDLARAAWGGMAVGRALGRAAGGEGGVAERRGGRGAVDVHVGLGSWSLRAMRVFGRLGELDTRVPALNSSHACGRFPNEGPAPASAPPVPHALVRYIRIFSPFTMALEPLEPLDPEYVRQRLAQPPFVTVPGVVNIRDLGSYPTSHAGMITRPRFLFRSGEISAITEEGTQLYVELSERHSARLTDLSPQAKTS